MHSFMWYSNNNATNEVTHSLDGLQLSVASLQSNNIVTVIAPIETAFVKDARLITRTPYDFCDANITPAQLLNEMYKL